MMNVVYDFRTREGLIMDFRIPGASFGCRLAYEEFAPERQLYEAAVITYAADRDEWALREALRSFPDLQQDDVEWHVANPGGRQPMHYMVGDLEAWLNG